MPQFDPTDRPVGRIVPLREYLLEYSAIERLGDRASRRVEDHRCGIEDRGPFVEVDPFDVRPVSHEDPDPRVEHSPLAQLVVQILSPEVAVDVDASSLVGDEIGRLLREPTLFVREHGPEVLNDAGKIEEGDPIEPGTVGARGAAEEAELTERLADLGYLE